MSKLVIYHGSDHIIHKPRFGFGKKYNDYGLGFYCTCHPDMAREWAVGDNRDGYINSYLLDIDKMLVMNLNNPEYTILNWLAILIDNRSFELSTPLAKAGKAYLEEYFLPDIKNTDVIRGYRADDSYFSFAQDFLNGTISVRQLENAMKLGKLGEQIVLKSEKAFEQIEELSSEKVSAVEWYPKRARRDRLARRHYSEMDKNEWIRGDIYMTHILDEGIKPDDIRLHTRL